MVDQSGFNTKAEADATAAEWRSGKYPRPAYTVRITRYRFGSSYRPCWGYNVTAYERHLRGNFATGMIKGAQ